MEIKTPNFNSSILSEGLPLDSTEFNKTSLNGTSTSLIEGSSSKKLNRKTKLWKINESTIY